MGTSRTFHVGAGDNRARRRRPLRRVLAPAVVIAVLLAAGTPTMATVGVRADMPVGGNDQPDSIADFPGGIAARVRSGDGELIPGELFLLLAVPGSHAGAELFDHTPYGLDRDQIHPEAVDSNQEAVRTVDFVTGSTPRLVDFTSAPGGGYSTGVTYTIAYLNMISDGAFTGDLVVAATGRLRSHGYVHPISYANEKAAAADFAGADVLFTPSAPTADVIDVHGARIVGELFRARNTGSTLRNERRWDSYEAWGARPPAHGMDVVGIRHIGDVAAYLCGAGSDFACDVTHGLEDVVIATAETTRHSQTAEHRPNTDANTNTNTRSTAS